MKCEQFHAMCTNLRKLSALQLQSRRQPCEDDVLQIIIQKENELRKFFVYMLVNVNEKWKLIVDTAMYANLVTMKKSQKERKHLEIILMEKFYSIDGAEELSDADKHLLIVKSKKCLQRN